MKKTMPCPCGRIRGKHALKYEDCCGPYLEAFDASPAPDAESLMRSRYTAFVRENAAYLMATWAPEHRPADLSFEPGIKWLGLDIRSATQLDTRHAEVEFIARSRVQGKGQRLHERSRFERRDGRWFYLDGEIFE